MAADPPARLAAERATLLCAPIRAVGWKHGKIGYTTWINVHAPDPNFEYCTCSPERATVRGA